MGPPGTRGTWQHTSAHSWCVQVHMLPGVWTTCTRADVMVQAHVSRAWAMPAPPGLPHPPLPSPMVPGDRAPRPYPYLHPGQLTWFWGVAIRVGVYPSLRLKIIRWNGEQDQQGCPATGGGPCSLHSRPSPSAETPTHLGECGWVGRKRGSGGPWGSRMDGEGEDPILPHPTPALATQSQLTLRAGVGAGLLQAVDEPVGLELQVLHQLRGAGIRWGPPAAWPSLPWPLPWPVPATVCRTWCLRGCRTCRPCPA